MFYSVGTMIIDHGQGVTSTFLHLSNSYVQVGDQVNQGQIVAAVGNSGRVTGPHLDWRINWFGIKIDPALALKIETIN
jgi:murein DD-endopeptidase MepM/ murein hydrolase activator NlpD